MKFLLKEKNLRTVHSRDICFFEMTQKELDVVKLQLKIIKLLDDVELSVEKVDEIDVIEINLNRFLKNKNDLKFVHSSSDLLSTYMMVYNGEYVTNLQKTVLFENCHKPEFQTFVKECKDEYGRTSINKLVKTILNNCTKR